MKSISARKFLELLNEGIPVFDTRAKAQFDRDGLKDAKHLPLEAIQKGHIPDIPKSHALYLVCEYGQISELGGLYLENAGFSLVYNVTGGMKALREQAKLDQE